MRRLHFVLCIACGTASARAQELIWAQNPANGHWYGTSHGEMTWFEAETAAVAQGGHLASFDNTAEFTWIPSAFSAYLASNYWIGLADVATEGSFTWTSGEPVSVTDWAPGEPDDHFGIEDAVEMQPLDGWRWHDANAFDFASRRPLAETPLVPRFGWRLPQIHPAGNYPVSVVSALIDGDSIPDLAVLSAIEEVVFVLRGTGIGTFVPLATVPIGAWPHELTVGDFNQDQITDFAVAASTLSEFRVFFGLGTGAFVNGPSFNTPGGAGALVVADLNGDARDDAVVVCSEGSNIRVFLANGTGSFFPSVGYPAGNANANVAAGDFDADGDVDLVVSNLPASVLRVLQNQGDGSFVIGATFATGITPRRAAVADLDGDGALDLAVPSFGSNRLHVHLGLGNGQFTSGYEVATGTSPASAAVIDVDGDGLPDVAVACASGVALHKNRGPGNLLAGELVPAGIDLVSLTARDLDGDARPDLAAVSMSLDALFVLRRLSRDCNGNGADDPRDIELGSSLDCNSNGEPDECDVASGATFDCNGNGAIDACEIANDPTLDLDADGAIDACESAGVGFCFGDGSGAPCPCDPGQSGDPGNGCRNSSGTSTHLDASGNPSVTLDSVTLLASGLPSSTVGLFFQGNQAHNGGLGAPFGDGLRCVSQSVIRLVVRSAVGGSMSYGHDHGGDPSVSIQGQVPSVGAVRHYQVWYRDAQSFCTSATWNLSNGVFVTWTP